MNDHSLNCAERHVKITRQCPVKIAFCYFIFTLGAFENRLLPYFMEPKAKTKNSSSAGCCLSEVEEQDGTSLARQAFFGDFLWRQKVT